MKKFTKVVDDVNDESLNENIREILPRMSTLSNNSQITNMVANTIIEKFDQKELRDFKQWLQLVESKIQLTKNKNRNRFPGL
jgi:hypothetical protein